MNLFTIENLSVEEITVLRQSLNVIDIKGSSAQFIANLQLKLDSELGQIQQMLQAEQNKKQAGIAKIEKNIKANS
jgi:hypothetical protein